VKGNERLNRKVQMADPNNDLIAYHDPIERADMESKLKVD